MNCYSFPSSLRPISEEDGNIESWFKAEYVYVMLVSRDGTSVMLREFETVGWTLPSFTYMNGLGYDMDRLGRDMGDALQLSLSDDKLPYSACVELFGSFPCVGSGGPDAGYNHLVMFECHEAPIRPPPYFSWKSAAFVHNLIMNYEASAHYEFGSHFDRALHWTHRFLSQRRTSTLELLREIRFKPGWHLRASKWFIEIVSSLGVAPSGCARQKRVSATSTVLSLRSSDGEFFLKAPSDKNEMRITAKLAQLQPRSVVEVVAESSELGCFVTRGLGEVEESAPQLLRVLAKVQLKSLHQIRMLRVAGCPDRSPLKLANQLEAWTRDDFMDSRILGGLLPLYVSVVPALLFLCDRLSKSSIPCTIVHGDFAERNVRKRTGGHVDEVALLDWEYSCISHPFCDMQWLFEDYDGYRDPAEFQSEDEDEAHGTKPKSEKSYLESLRQAREEYLTTFGAQFSVSNQDLRKEFEAGRVLGRFLMIWAAYDVVRNCHFPNYPEGFKFISEAFESAHVMLVDLGLAEPDE